MRYLLALFIAFAPVLLAQAQIDQALSEIDKEIADRTRQMTAQRDELTQQQQELQQALETLATVQQDLNAAEQKVLSGDTNAERQLRFTKLLLNREQDKVDRIRQRIAETDTRLVETQTEIDTATARREQLTNRRQQPSQPRESNPIAEIKPPPNPVAMQTARPKPVPATETKSAPATETKLIATIAAPTANKRGESPANAKNAPQPQAANVDSWPYLSDGSAAEWRYASERLLHLQTQKELGEITTAPLTSIEIKAPLAFGTAQMEYLGESLFSVVKALPAGRHNFQLFNQEYWHVIPESDHNADYRFIYDISSLSKPTLYLFREDLVQP